MRILVLGGTHFIGPPAVRRLIEAGHEVTVFHRGQSNADLPEQVRHIHGDRKNLEDFAVQFARLSPDAVLDTFAFSEADGQQLLRLFNGIAGRLVVLSSADVYRAYDHLRRIESGPAQPSPLTEDSPLRERLYPYRQPETKPEEFAYSYEKILLERAVQSVPESLPTTVLRLPMVYGPGDYQHRVREYLQLMDSGTSVIDVAEEAAGWIAPRGYVEDMGRAIELCVTHPAAKGRTYHAGDLKPLTELEWLHRIGEAAGWSGELRLVPMEQLPPERRMDLNFEQQWALDSSRIRVELGYAEAVDGAEAMQRTVEWERVESYK